MRRERTRGIQPTDEPRDEGRLRGVGGRPFRSNGNGSSLAAFWAWSGRTRSKGSLGWRTWTWSFPIDGLRLFAGCLSGEPNVKDDGGEDGGVVACAGSGGQAGTWLRWLRLNTSSSRNESDEAWLLDRLCRRCCSRVRYWASSSTMVVDVPLLCVDSRSRRA